MRYKTVKFSNPEIDNLLQEVKDGDFDVTVTEDDIDSGEATAGQVLTADGEGGAQFTDPITYESKPAASEGTDVSLVTTGEKYNWDNKQDAITRDQPVDLAMVVGLDSQDNVVTGEVRAVNIDSGNASSGQVLTADGSGGASWGNIPVPSEISYLTTAPSSANLSGNLKFVVLSSDPATKYSGYVYIITGSN